MEVASGWGRGSTFTVVLPAGRKAPPPEEQAPRLEDVPGGHETVLLAEDEPTVRSLISRTLSQGGYRVLAAGHGPAALRLWEAEGGQIDLLLTDIVMPEGMNGRELAEELRRRKSGLKVIFNSGSSRDVLSTGAALLPQDVYLPKPFEPVLLARAVRTCLDAR